MEDNSSAKIEVGLGTNGSVDEGRGIVQEDGQQSDKVRTEAQPAFSASATPSLAASATAPYGTVNLQAPEDSGLVEISEEQVARGTSAKAKGLDSTKSPVSLKVTGSPATEAEQSPSSNSAPIDKMEHRDPRESTRDVPELDYDGFGPQSSAPTERPQPPQRGRHTEQTRQGRPIASSHPLPPRPDVQIASKNREQKKGGRHIYVGSKRLELQDSWIAATDQRTWQAPARTRSPPPAAPRPRYPAMFRGEMTLDSWTAERDGRAPPAASGAVASPARSERIGTPKEGRGDEMNQKEGRASPLYEPYTAAQHASRGRGNRGGKRKRDDGDSVREERENKRRADSEANRDRRRENPFGAMAAAPADRHKAPLPQQRRR